MSRPRVVVTERIDPAGLGLLRAEADTVELFDRAGESLNDHLPAAEGRIAGAGIDVFETEPPPADHPLLSLPSAIVTSHVAGSSRESLRAISRTVAEEVLRVLRGEPPRFPVP
jgi:D-3-phosphoglycerate dehydrogenase